MHSGNNSKKNNNNTGEGGTGEKWATSLLVGMSVLGGRGVTTIFNIVHTFHSLSACWAYLQLVKATTATTAGAVLKGTLCAFMRFYGCHFKTSLPLSLSPSLSLFCLFPGDIYYAAAFPDNYLLGLNSHSQSNERIQLRIFHLPTYLQLGGVSCWRGQAWVEAEIFRLSESERVARVQFTSRGQSPAKSKSTSKSSKSSNFLPPLDMWRRQLECQLERQWDGDGQWDWEW